MRVGRSRAKVFDAERPATTFADVAGYEGAKAEIAEVGHQGRHQLAVLHGNTLGGYGKLASHLTLVPWAEMGIGLRKQRAAEGQRVRIQREQG
jgi:hypothetical protein